MKKRQRKKMAPKPKGRKLVNLRDVHWWATDDGYEHIKRTIFDQGILTISKAERALWLPPGWEKRLADQRKRHRAAGINDKNFWHPARTK